MMEITLQTVLGIFTLLFAYLGWRSSAIPNETERIRNIRERFDETVNITDFYLFEIVRVQVNERKGPLVRGAKYVPFFPYQGKTSVYLRFESPDGEELPKIALVDQIIDHSDYNEEYDIARMTRNHRGATPSIDVELIIETGDPQAIHGSIQHFSGILLGLGEQKSPIDEDYYNQDYTSDRGN